MLEKTYRFPVLAHWSFTGTNEGDFRSLAQGLDVGLLGTEVGTVWGIDPAGSPTTRSSTSTPPRPGDPPRPDPPEVAETGHVGLPQTTRRGEAARAWYRGPFVPLPTDRDPADAALPHVSDQLRTLTPDGREDVSLAAAFEIGRLLGLSQPALVRALVQWRAEQFGAGPGRAARQPADRRRRSRSTRPGWPATSAGWSACSSPPSPEPAPATRPRSSGRAARSPTRAGPSSSRGSLDTGRRRRPRARPRTRSSRSADAVGMTAALAGTEVAVGRSDGAFDPAALAGLRARLDAELTRVAAAAVPTTRPVRAPKGGRRRTADAADAVPEVVPDALDELLGTRPRRGGGTAMKASFTSATAMLQLQYVAAKAGVIGDLAETDPDDGPHVVPGAIRRALAELRLLHSVPFSYLVPDATLLPPGVDPLLLPRPQLDRRAGRGRAQHRHLHQRRAGPARSAA